MSKDYKLLAKAINQRTKFLVKRYGLETQVVTLLLQNPQVVNDWMPFNQMSRRDRIKVILQHINIPVKDAAKIIDCTYRY